MPYSSPPALSCTYNRLHGKVILVTGATSGIGEAAAKLFAQEGASVVVTARRQEKLDTLVDALRENGYSAAAVACDVTDEGAIERTVSFAVEHFGRLDGAFNNAGVAPVRGPMHELKMEDFDHILNTNLRGVFMCMKYEIKAMLKTGGGNIVNTSSIGGLVGTPGNSIHAASKWGLAGLTKCAALDYARQGIRVNGIAPGPTHSEGFYGLYLTEAIKEKVADSFPMNYIAQPDDMARAALFLLSDESRWTTGTIFPCEGGRSAT
ncbi:hypothetical protein MMC11_008148 [Xylographa trunciseda]|nr:hypothetical protein [Xylographa trunciseda]